MTVDSPVSDAGAGAVRVAIGLLIDLLKYITSELKIDELVGREDPKQVGDECD